MSKSAVERMMRPVPDTVTVAPAPTSGRGEVASFEVSDPGGHVVLRLGARMSNSGDALGLIVNRSATNHFREWDAPSVAASALYGMYSAAVAFGHVADPDGSLRKKAFREFRGGAPIPPQVRVVVDAVHAVFLSTRGEGVARRKESIKVILRELRGRVSEDELVELWRVITVEEVLQS